MKVSILCNYIIITFQESCILCWKNRNENVTFKYIDDVKFLFQIETTPRKEQTNKLILEVYIENQETNEISVSNVPIEFFPYSIHLNDDDGKEGDIIKVNVIQNTLKYVRYPSNLKWEDILIPLQKVKNDEFELTVPAQKSDRPIRVYLVENGKKISNFIFFRYK